MNSFLFDSNLFEIFQDKMGLKVISQWILVIAIASFMGTCLIKASEAKRRLSFFQDYPPTKYFSDAHDKYIVEKQGSIYPIRLEIVGE